MNVMWRAEWESEHGRKAERDREHGREGGMG